MDPLRSFPVQRAEFQLLRKIGEGGMAEVFLAERAGDENFKTLVALKRLHAGFALDQYFIRQLVAEARLLGQLQHNNIVRVHDLRRIDDDYFIVMEYIDGIDLAQAISVHRDRDIRIPLAIFFHIALSLCEALDFAHSATDLEGRAIRLIHRDIKPSNVLLSARGIVKLTDFGIARVGDTVNTGSVVKGTANYMSPEQASGETNLTPASDIFSLGAVLWEMLTLEKLVDGNNYLNVIHAIKELNVGLKDITKKGIEPNLRMILLRLLARKRELRYQNMGLVLKDLRFVAEQMKVDLSPSHVRDYIARTIAMAKENALRSMANLQPEPRAAVVVAGAAAASEAPAAVVPAHPAGGAAAAQGSASPAPAVAPKGAGAARAAPLPEPVSAQAADPLGRGPGKGRGVGGPSAGEAPVVAPSPAAAPGPDFEDSVARLRAIAQAGPVPSPAAAGRNVAAPAQAGAAGQASPSIPGSSASSARGGGSSVMEPVPASPAGGAPATRGPVPGPLPAPPLGSAPGRPGDPPTSAWKRDPGSGKPRPPEFDAELAAAPSSPALRPVQAFPPHEAQPVPLAPEPGRVGPGHAGGASPMGRPAGGAPALVSAAQVPPAVIPGPLPNPSVAGPPLPRQAGPHAPGPALPVQAAPAPSVPGPVPSAQASVVAAASRAPEVQAPHPVGLPPRPAVRRNAGTAEALAAVEAARARGVASGQLPAVPGVGTPQGPAPTAWVPPAPAAQPPGTAPHPGSPPASPVSVSHLRAAPVPAAGAGPSAAHSMGQGPARAESPRPADPRPPPQPPAAPHAQAPLRAVVEDDDDEEDDEDEDSAAANRRVVLAGTVIGGALLAAILWLALRPPPGEDELVDGPLPPVEIATEGDPSPPLSAPEAVGAPPDLAAIAAPIPAPPTPVGQPAGEPTPRAAVAEPRDPPPPDRRDPPSSARAEVPRSSSSTPRTSTSTSAASSRSAGERPSERTPTSGGRAESPSTSTPSPSRTTSASTSSSTTAAASTGVLEAGGLDFTLLSEKAKRGQLDEGEVRRLRAVPAGAPAWKESRAVLLAQFEAGGNTKSHCDTATESLRAAEAAADPQFQLEMSKCDLREGRYDAALQHARTAEQHAEDIPSRIRTDRQLKIWEVQAKAYKGLYQGSEKLDHLQDALSVWKRYRNLAANTYRQRDAERADQEIQQIEKLARDAL